MSRLAALTISLSLLSSSLAVAQPSLSHAIPQAVAPGRTTELKLHGAKLQGALQVWTSFPAKTELVVDPKVATMVTCRVTVDANAGVRVGGLMIGNANGVSDPLYLMVDDLPSQADTTNHSVETAQVLTVPVAVDGASNGAQSDFYKFTAKAQQTISMEVLAQRMGSAFDPVLQLLDAQGAELALADDDEALGADCRLAFTFPADGEYLLKVTDNKFSAGGRYRLRVGDFPIVSTPFPLAARVGSVTKFAFAGDPSVHRIVQIPHQANHSLVAVNGKRPNGVSSAIGLVAASGMPEAIDIEPNDVADAATSVVMPCGISGRFDKQGDVDTFQFVAVKGQRLTFDAISRSVSSPTIVSMRVLKADGAVLGQTSATDDDEERLTVTFPDEGTYRLVAEELLGRGGPTYTYRIATRSGPTFDLAIKNDAKLSTKFHPFVANGAFTVEVQCARIGYDGPIQLEIDGDASGLQLYNALIPAKAKAHRVIVAVTADAQAGDMHAFRLRGRATDGEAPAEAVVSTVAYMRVKTPLVSYPPVWRDGLFSSSVGAAGGAYFAVSFDKPSLQVAQGGNVTIALKLERKDKNFKAGITIIPPDLPAGVSYAVKQDKDVYNVTLTAAADAAVGNHTVRWRSFGDINNRGQIVLSELPVEVTKPAGVAQAK